MVELSRLAETCTPSSFWPDAEVIDPVSNWSAEAVLAAPTRTRLATPATNWPRRCVMVFLSFRSLRIGGPERLGLARSTNAKRRDRPISSERVVGASARFSKASTGKVAPSFKGLRRTASSLELLLRSNALLRVVDERTAERAAREVPS